VIPMGIREAMERALSKERDADPREPLDAFAPLDSDPEWSGTTVLRDTRTATSSAPPATVFAALERIGGTNGWYAASWLWSVRGLLDQLVGGPGLRRGRATSLAKGEPLDFWRVEELSPPNCLRLRAEMRLPGEAWLTWHLEAHGTGTKIVQRADFHPRGFLGRAYWYAIAPFHRWVFPGMLNGIIADAEGVAITVRRGRKR